MKATDTQQKQNTRPLSVKGLNVYYKHLQALENIDFEADAEKMTAIIGPNGAGKSTLIKAVLGLIPYQAQSVSFFGTTFKASAKRIAYIPQRTSVDWNFPVNVLDVVCMGLYRDIGWFKPIRKKHKDTALACLEKVKLADYAEQQIGQLSGGQQQRVFLARALVQDADLYIMDEPLAGVDAKSEEMILGTLQELKKKKKTILCVHHDLLTVEKYFDKALLLNKKKIAAGAVKNVLTESHLTKAYEGLPVMYKER